MGTTTTTNTRSDVRIVIDQDSLAYLIRDYKRQIKRVARLEKLLLEVRGVFPACNGWYLQGCDEIAEKIDRALKGVR